MANSLSDNNAPLKRVRETFDRPKTREELIASLSRILALGKVQKLTVEVNQPIRVERLVPQEAPVPEDLKGLEETDEWTNVIRNGRLEDFPMKGMHPFLYLFHVFNFVAAKRLKPKVLLVHAIGELRSWLEIDAFVNMESLFGVEVLQHPAIPDDTATLITEDPGNADADVYCMRLVFDKPKEKSNEATGGEGSQERNRGPRNGRAAGKVGQPS